MFRHYQLTEREKDVVKLYQLLGITKPSQLTPEFVSAALGIHLIYKEDVISQAYENGKFRCIVLDSLLPELEQRKIFFHELGHLLRGHAGNQADNEMPKLFRDLQEEQAEHFAIYSLMPMFMIEQIEFPEYQRDMPYVLAEEFQVSIELAQQRWDQIQRRLYEGRSTYATKEIERSRIRKATPADWCHEAKEAFRVAIQRKLEKGQGVVFR